MPEFYKADYQMHSFRSHDGRSSIRDYCMAAIEKGVDEIGFSEHKDFAADDEYRDYFDYPAYRAEIEAARAEFGERLVILCGVEIDYRKELEDEIAQWLADHRFDYVMGNVHAIEGVSITSEEFHVGKTREAAYGEYFSAVRDSVEFGGFDIIGHLEYINRRASKFWGDYMAEPFEILLRELFRAMVAKGSVLEMNSGGLHRGLGVLLPSIATFRLYAEEGGEWIAFGSDAHEASQVGYEIDATLAELNGVKRWKLAIFRDRKRIERTLTL